jgi:hypothetical protein
MKKHALKRKERENLFIIVHFLVANYIPMWFRLNKKSPSLEKLPDTCSLKLNFTSFFLRKLARKSYIIH